VYNRRSTLPDTCREDFDTVNRITAVFVLFLLAVTVSSPVLANQNSSESEPISREESAEIEIHATISDINYETREVDLTDSSGKVRSLTVDPRVKRFSELKVGDKVTVDIVVSALAEVRAPTEEELANPGSVSRGTVRSPGSGGLAGSVTEVVKSVVTIVGLNLLNESITVLTEEGELVDVRVENVDNLKKLRLGDTIVVTYFEAVAVSVEQLTATGE